MKAFTYERASTPAEAAAAAARTPGAKFIAGGTNLLDLMKLEIETPTHLIDVNGLALDRIEATADGGLRIGALVRNTDLAADPRVRRDYARPLPRAPRRRLGPAAQQGDDRRQSAAAHALPLFLRHRPAVQQAPARQRLRGDRRLQPAARRHRRERCVHRDAPERHGRGDARARCHGRDGAAGRHARAAIPIADFHRLPGDTPQHRDDAGGRRADHRRDAAEAARRHAHLSQGARPRVVCLRAGLGRRHRAARRQRPRRAGRRRAQALARRGRRSRAAARREGRDDAAARRREADARERLQAAAGRTHARRGAGGSEEPRHEIRHARHDQSDRPAAR